MRYNDAEHIANWDYGNDGKNHPDEHAQKVFCYQEGVDRVFEYVESIHAYPKLMAELKWAVERGII